MSAFWLLRIGAADHRARTATMRSISARKRAPIKNHVDEQRSGRGFGRLILGETWVNHWGHTAKRARAGWWLRRERSSIVRGIQDGDIWGTTDVYQVRHAVPAGEYAVDHGPGYQRNGSEGSSGRTRDRRKSGKVTDKNNRCCRWRGSFYKGARERGARSFTTTMGGQMLGAHVWRAKARRLLVKRVYWAVGRTTRFQRKRMWNWSGSFGTFKKGMKPADGMK